VHRDVFATCPRCARALDAGSPAAGTADRSTWLECGSCQGALVPDQVLYDRISDAQIQTLLTSKRKTPWRREEFATGLALAPSRDGDSQIPCPRCAANMSKHLLYDVEIDRCEGHGVWLDGENELRLVLVNAAARI
jgi:hypothetical protein